MWSMSVVKALIRQTLASDWTNLDSDLPTKPRKKPPYPGAGVQGGGSPLASARTCLVVRGYFSAITSDQEIYTR